MELLLEKFYYIHNNKNLIIHNILELKNRMLNYLNLTYSLSLYLLKLVISHFFILLKKIVPIKIKFKMKQILFSNKKFWRFLVSLKNWVKTPPAINKVRQINKIIFSFIAVFFIPLFIFIIKKEKWKILMLERLKNNYELKTKFKKFTSDIELSVNENLASIINTDSLNRSELNIYKNLSNALYLTKN